ncbi:MAG TPA: VOC family protein [Chitinophagaceae bacterium]|nr:MAG: Glyoxalase/bleomycin resistance protein/dioxygenase [Bacteroidetes bacterium OLB11]HMN32707.1 VOC family protein [Chitinophagaceae bacterium]
MTSKVKNPFTWVEIYVEDMNRAKTFYETVFQTQLTELPMSPDFGDMQMFSFGWAEGEPNISGALVKMRDMKPGAGGTLVYFVCDNCSVEESRIESAGGKVLNPKMSIGEHGFCSIIMDTEGNTIGLHSGK